jgi:hypothetical protein
MKETRAEPPNLMLMMVMPEAEPASKDKVKRKKKTVEPLWVLKAR